VYTPTEPLPDLSGLDAAELAARSDHPILAAVAAELVAWWPDPEEARADFEDSASGLRRDVA
jgi:hypothetical protein